MCGDQNSAAVVSDDATLPEGGKSRDDQRSGANYQTTIRALLFACGLAVGSYGIFHVVRTYFVNTSSSSGITPTSLDVKPQSDTRQYQYYTLPNGLAVVNVLDTQTTQAAFSVSVDAGSNDNPKQFPGLAHFCEHMIFLGTHKYPDPLGFDNFIAQAGGYNNAYTADEKTVYYAEVSEASSSEGMDRVADFFRAPLFNKDYVEKEVHAIDSEHSKNVQDPGRRIFEIFNRVSNPENPSSWFGTGNTETLFAGPKAKGLSAVDALKDWNQKHYCPNKMRLVTFGPMDMNTQFDMSEKMFGDIPKGSDECQGARRSWATPAKWPVERMRKFISIEGNTPKPQLWVHFPLPDMRAYYKSSPTAYMDYVLNYGGEDSLYWILSDALGYVTNFEASGSTSSTGTDYFLTYDLTEKGRDHYKEVLDLTLAYILKMQTAGVDEALLASLHDLSKLSWDWSTQQEGSKLAMGLAASAIDTPASDLLLDSLAEPNSKLSADFMAKLRPDNMNVALVDSKANTTLFPGQNVQTVKEYGARYAVQNLNQSKDLAKAYEQWNEWFTAGVAGVEASSKATSGIVAKAPGLPKPITDLPTQLNTDHMRATVAVGSPSAETFFGKPPETISLSTASIGTFAPQAWYRSGWVTISPKVSIAMSLVMPRKADSFEVPVEDSLRISIYGGLLGQEMTPKLYDITNTGVTYALSFTTHSIDLVFQGYAPLLPRLMDEVLAEFDKGVTVTDTSRYDRLINDQKLSLQSFNDNPLKYAVADRNTLISQGAHSTEEVLQALDKMTATSSASSVKKLLLSHKLVMQGLAMGNLGEASAKAAFDKVLTRTQSWEGAKTVPAADEKVRRISPVVKPSTPVEVRRLSRRQGDTNDATVVSFLVGPRTVESRVMGALLTGILHNSAYSYLRTTKQLGYIVSAGVSPMSNVDYVSVVVQGDVLKADKVEAQIEYVYSVLMPQELANMTDVQFQGHKESLRQKLLAPPTDFAEEFSHFLGPLTEESPDCLGLQSEMLTHLTTITSKDLLVKEWERIAYPDTRTKLVVKHFAGSVPTRPSLIEAQAIWKDAEIPATYVKRLTKEYETSKVYDKADSSTRADILKNGGTLYPPDVNCKRVSASPSLLDVVHMRKMKTPRQESIGSD
jgi:secreted Zn-dependent insulinase-like peptidase